MTGAKGAQHRHRRSLAPPRSWLIACLLLLVPAAGPAWAQTQRPVIAVVPIAPVASATSTTQVPFLIQVGPSDVVPPGSFVRVRGLPAMAGLSEGHSIAPGSWAIPIAALPRLKITLPAADTGRSQLTITLVASDGSALAEASYVLVVAAPRPANAPAIGGALPSAPGSVAKAAPLRAVPQPTPAAPLMAPEDRERALRLVKKGDEQLAEGGIAQARLLYERAAEAGLAQGAMALAATYDPSELSRLGVRGLEPDRQAARRWYQRALQLGAREAVQRLQQLDAE